MFRQVVGTLFALMKYYAATWRAIQVVQPAPLIGEPGVLQGEPEEVPVTAPAMMARLREGTRDHADTLRQVLAAEQQAALGDIAAYDDKSFAFPPKTWARVVFDFAVAYHKGVLPLEQIMAAMAPLYYGRTAGLVKEAAGMNPVEFEQHVVQAQAETFLRLKSELVARWG